VKESLARGATVALRPPVEADRAEYLERLEASRELHTPWLETADPPAWFDRILARASAPEDRSLLVWRAADDRLVGVVNVSQIHYGPLCSAYLGYYVFAPYARAGLMREALALTVGYAFGPLGLHRLEANVQPGNEASLALVRSVGFRREGFSPRYLKIRGAWCDHERWAITVEDRSQG
jgi:ribosomal-protein-alanine N-acetyltransferase